MLDKKDKITVGDLAQLLHGCDILTIYQNGTMIYDGLVKDVKEFSSKEILQIDVIGYRQLVLNVRANTKIF